MKPVTGTETQAFLAVEKTSVIQPKHGTTIEVIWRPWEPGRGVNNFTLAIMDEEEEQVEVVLNLGETVASQSGFLAKFNIPFVNILQAHEERREDELPSLVIAELAGKTVLLQRGGDTLWFHLIIQPALSQWKKVKTRFPLRFFTKQVEPLQFSGMLALNQAAQFFDNL